MDIITHIVLGGYFLFLMLSRFIHIKKSQHLYMLVFALVCSVLADVEYLVAVFDSLAYLQIHRVILNSVFVLPILALAVSLVFWLYNSKITFSKYFSFSIIIIAFHIFLDLLNSYPSEILWPIGKQFHLDLFPIVEPYLMAGLIAGLVIVRTVKDSKKKVVNGVFILFVLLLLARGSAHALAVQDVREGLDDYNEFAVIPQFSCIGCFKIVADYPEEVRVLNFKLGATSNPGMHFPKEDSKAMDSARRLDSTKVFLDFARFPYAITKESEKGYVVKYSDMTYYNAKMEILTLTLHFDNNYNLVNKEFKY